MKGLVYKDLLALKQSMMTTAAIMVLYIVMGIMSSDGSTLFCVMAGVMNMMIPLTCAAYAEQCGWDSFGNALPVSRTKTVLARYCTGMVVMLATLLLVAAAQVIMMFTGNSAMDWSVYIAVVLISLLINAVMNPIVYKFGVQKSRFVMMAVFLVPTIIFSAIAMLAITSENDLVINIVDSIGSFIDSLTQIPDIVLMLGILAVFAIIYALSILLSISIYKKKDL